MRYNVDLTTPEAVARQLNTVNPAGSVPVVITDKANAQYANFWSYATECCQSASAYIATGTGRTFVPYRDDITLPYAEIAATIRRGRVALPEDLLIPSSLAFGDVSISTDDYYLSPSNTLPASALYLSSTALNGATYSFGVGFLISGIWGYVSNLAQAWSLAQASLSIGSTSVETITVSVGTAVRYETLSYLKIDDEYLQITDIDLATDVLTVLRGVNGTTAAIHSSKPLYRFNVEGDIAKAATLLASYFYQRRSDAAGSIQLPEGGINLDAFPIAVDKTIRAYQRKVYSSVLASASWR